jgi:hypothetical protein
MAACEGTIHHLIALFCTVAGKRQGARRMFPAYCNEIKDLAPHLHDSMRQNPF